MTHYPEGMVEIEVTLLSGEGKLLEVHSNTSLKQLRKMQREAWNCPFITLLSDEGAELDFVLPLAWQVTPVQGRISVQAMAQQPIVTCNQNAAVLWCPNNPFLCALGSEYSGIIALIKQEHPIPDPYVKCMQGHIGSWLLKLMSR